MATYGLFVLVKTAWEALTHCTPVHLSRLASGQTLGPSRLPADLQGFVVTTYTVTVFPKGFLHVVSTGPVDTAFAGAAV
jgi:hypothetical protein